MIDENSIRRPYVLTVLTALPLPIKLVAGLFGMNVGGIPFAEHESGLWMVLSLLATATAESGSADF